MEMVIQGVSTRKVTEITETLCGTSFSKSTVSALCSQLDPAIDEFRNRPLEKHYPFISADAIYMRVRKNKRIISIGLLIAIGVNQEGKREILGFTTNKGESTSAWADFFKELKNRGLTQVDIVTSDNHGGIREAIKQEFPGTAWQRCQTHFSKNVLDKTPKKIRSDLHRALTDMYNAPNLEECCNRRDNILEKYSETAPEATNTIEEGFDDIVSVFALPVHYRKKIRTSNNIERLNEELRRRERVIRIFPNEQSLIRLMGAVLMEIHEKWISGRNYLNMDDYYSEFSAAAPMGANPLLCIGA